jgi:hypothetical protein
VEAWVLGREFKNPVLAAAAMCNPSGLIEMAVGATE